MTQPTALVIGNFSSSWGASPTASEAFAQRLGTVGWRVLTASHKRRRLVKLADMLWTTWRSRRDYDVACVDVYSGAAFVWAVAVCSLLRMLGKPYVLSLHGGGLPEFALRWGRSLHKLAANSAGVVAQSGYLAACLPEDKSLVVEIPNGIDIGLYPFRARPTPEPRLVWLRAFHEIYNPCLAVRVLAILKPDLPAATLTMVGSDKGDGSLAATRNEAKALGVSAHVEFPGGVAKSNVPAWLSKGDIFLNTSDFDNTPVSVEEALACGLCVVSTDVGGMPYLVENGADGLLVAPRDPEAMAAAVRQILRDQGLAGRLSAAGRQKAQDFDWSRVLPKWEELLSAAARSGRRARGK